MEVFSLISILRNLHLFVQSNHMSRFMHVTEQGLLQYDEMKNVGIPNLNGCWIFMVYFCCINVCIPC